MKDLNEQELNKIIFKLLGSKGPGYCADYTTNWKKAGQIIEREGINLIRVNDIEGSEHHWKAYMYQKGVLVGLPKIDYFFGPTALIAAMRCFVASKLK